MADMLSQDEINALFGPEGSEGDAEGSGGAPGEQGQLTKQDKDVLGEVGNISMGTAASTLSTLLDQRVEITTPHVSIKDWNEIAGGYDRPCVGIRVNYVEGINGTNILVLKERDVKIITDLMMGGDGLSDPTGEINEIDLSAIAECMNQMIGSSSTSLSSMVKTKIDIDTPDAFVLDFGTDDFFTNVEFAGEVVACIRFRMEISDLIDSEIMQIWPLDFAGQIVKTFITGLNQPARGQAPEPEPPKAATPPAKPAAPQPQAAAPPPAAAPAAAAPPPHAAMPGAPQMPNPYGYPPPGYVYPPPSPVYAQPVAFESFDPMGPDAFHKENFEIIRDVPLDVTVELGRTVKKIKEILEFQPGSIVELNKLAGETMDVLINGKFVARGEVVVIDENFAVRITDIISAEHRI